MGYFQTLGRPHPFHSAFTFLNVGCYKTASTCKVSDKDRHNSLPPSSLMWALLKDTWRHTCFAFGFLDVVGRVQPCAFKAPPPIQQLFLLVANLRNFGHVLNGLPKRHTLLSNVQFGADSCDMKVLCSIPAAEGSLANSERTAWFGNFCRRQPSAEKLCLSEKPRKQQQIGGELLGRAVHGLCRRSTGGAKTRQHCFRPDQSGQCGDAESTV